MHHTVCIHITCLATHCSANYPTLCGSSDNNYHQTLGADEVACMKWSSDPDSFLLCLRFALFVSFIFRIFFFPPCEIAHLDGRQMAQRAPKRAPTPTSHLAAVRPPPPNARVQNPKHRLCHRLSFARLSHLFHSP